MSKSKRAARTHARRSRPPTRAAKSRRPGLTTVAIVFVALVFGAGGLYAYKKNWERSHDLSVIGNGVHTVVQVHDPGCRLCQSLKASTKAALKDVDEPIQYRIADINTPQGRAIQRRYQVPHVTLLLFEPDGDLARTLTGVKSASTLRHVFNRFLEGPRPG